MNLAEWSTPFKRFAEVFEAAHRAVPKDPNAMTLATVDANGRPSLRTVLLKGFDEQGFVFYTNTRSAKGRALHDTGLAALNFYWPTLDQQVRIEGTVEAVTPEEADAYFASRARASQLGAWASHQSETLSTRAELEARLEEVTKKYEGGEVPRPPHWSGYRVLPERIEFWKAQEHRLHWREEYVKAGAAWEHHWLNP
jgi:pyridoxamine 5'-phosphate oxidase